MSKNPLVDKSVEYIKKMFKGQKKPEHLIPFINFKEPLKKNVGTIPFVNFKDPSGHKRKLKEELEDTLQRWKNHNENAHIGKYVTDISDRLVEKSPELKDEDHLEQVKRYTISSKRLNSHLLFNTTQGPDRETLNSRAKILHKITSHPIGHDIHLYSGVTGNPRHWQKDDNGYIHLKAFTSMTHSKHVAHNFAIHTDEQGNHHIIHLHLKPTDHGLHVEHVTENRHEHETIIPADTKLKPHPDYKGPDEYYDSDTRNKTFVHHYVIHSQTHPDHYEPRS